MGRRKLEMKLIPNKAARMISFNKRKESLKKKLDELKTLCGVEGCIIIQSPDDDDQQKPQSYPPDQIFKTCQIIHEYQSKKGDHRMCKNFGLPDFFHEKRKKAEEELDKLKTRHEKYPTWDEKFDEVKDPAVLRAFAHQLRLKCEIAKSRVDFLKKTKNQEFMDINPLIHDVASTSAAGPAVAPPFYVNLPDYGSYEYHWQNTNFQIAELTTVQCGGGGDYLPPQPQPCVNFPIDDQSGGDYLQPQPQPCVNFPIEDQSGGNYYPYVMENDEGTQYLLPFDY